MSAEVADIFHADADFFPDFSGDAIFKGFTGFDESGQNTEISGLKPFIAGQQQPVANLL